MTDCKDCPVAAAMLREKLDDQATYRQLIESNEQKYLADCSQYEKNARAMAMKMAALRKENRKLKAKLPSEEPAPKQKRGWWGWETRQCVFCRSDFEVIRSKKKKYCNVECYHRDMLRLEYSKKRS